MSRIKRSLPEEYDISEVVDYGPKTIEVMDETDMAVNDLFHAIAVLEDHILTGYVPELEKAILELDELVLKTRKPF